MTKTAYPGVYKRGSRYVVKYLDHRGAQRKESFRTLADAREAKGRRQSGERRAYSRQPFTDYATEWLDTYQGRTARGLSDSTRRSYRRSIEQWAMPFFGRMKLGDIDPPDVRAFVAHMQKKGARAPTVRKTMAPVKALFATAAEDGPGCARSGGGSYPRPLGRPNPEM